MFIIIFSLLNISIQLNQQCNTILNKDCCIDQCEWENEQCQTKKAQNYCNSNNFNEEQCRQNPICAFYNGKCEPFFGCQTYQNIGSNCPRVSINCISITDEPVCIQKPINCIQISESKYCGQIDHQQGSKESCEWKDDKCQFTGCEKVNEFGQLSELKCQKFHNVCKFDGIECKIKLQYCSSYLYNCNQITAITGKCQLNSIKQSCMNASCYNYFEDSYEKCQKHFGQYGSQCIYNKDYFGGICLEIDYKTQVGKCMVEMQDKSCNQYLLISKCFGINSQKYDQKISFCQEGNIDLERRECNTSLNEQECNTIETIELKKCQWIKNTCQTINQCSDYELNFDSTEKTCDELNLGCKQIPCQNNIYGCCVQIQECNGYQTKQECTNNSDNFIIDLQYICIWENNSCRYGKCEDFNNDIYQCNNLEECRYIGKQCQNKKFISCEGLEIQDCIRLNCFYIMGKCYSANEIYKDIYSLSKTLEQDENTVCQYFSDKLMYSSDTRNCVLKSQCKNYSYNCQSMKQYDNVQCVNINSECRPMTSCTQLSYSEVEKCYKASSVCNTNGKTCEIAEKLCTSYKDQNSCNFQLDLSICQWDTNGCHLKKCEEIEDINQCDSKNLCMNPQVCRQNMCVQSNNYCITIKSRCSLYLSQISCYKSINSFCFWNGQYCMDLMNCQILSITQCQNEKYNHTCIFDYDFNECKNRKHSTSSSLNQTCLQNNYNYNYYCNTQENRDKIISSFKNT
ncbi:unnamed protein product [Paramecium primaurelia]|uniref:Transmembrane protein n=1 Tax=Paramecium primaurelia TaxID=5886 RepID=A0A8S1M0A0_PARPR|nr:unnamed protein product [Paramecium primaurelia]